MKNKKVRKAVFETNSSSSHSLHIDDSVDVFQTLSINSGYIDELERVVQNAVIVNGGEFGWAWEKFTDAESKASYLATMLLSLEEQAKSVQGKPGDEISEYGLNRFAANQYLDCLNNFTEVIKEQTGALEVIIQGSGNWDSNNYAYIDHQSFECEDDASILLDKDKMRNFIFNPKSVLHTGNDNSGPPLNFYCDNNEAKFHLTVEGYSTVGNLKTKNLEEVKESIDAIVNDDDAWGGDINWDTQEIVYRSGWGNDKKELTFKFTIKDV